ncbi:MAG: S46 family peptidase, partial [Bacteroidia bacterium]
KKFYPNANSTMRLTYGQVKEYEPRDAVEYEEYTTLNGVMEKEDPSNPEFVVPAGLKNLYKQKDFGIYGQDGELHTCFISTNDITGGNSGSPVINGKGHLIGCAFDGNWEAMSGDIFFEDQIQRTISVDIRYVLFLIDKLGGAGHIVDEMKLLRKGKEVKRVG